MSLSSIIQTGMSECLRHCTLLVECAEFPLDEKELLILNTGVVRLCCRVQLRDPYRLVITVTPVFMQRLQSSEDDASSSGAFAETCSENISQRSMGDTLSSQPGQGGVVIRNVRWGPGVSLAMVTLAPSARTKC